MQRTATRILALCLALCLLFGMTALADQKDYINYDGYRPIVKDGNDVTLSVAVDGWTDWAWTDPEENWAIHFIREKLNINLDASMILGDQRNERVNLMFAADDLPDLLMIGFSTIEYVRYGQQESQLLALDEYINEDTMPIYNEALNTERYAALRESLTLEDGHMYAFGSVTDYSLTPSSMTNNNNNCLWFVREAFLEESGIAKPTTVDEFTDLLRAYKQANPDKVALAGSAQWNDPRPMLYNTLGYTSSDSLGLNPATRGGEAAIPAANDDYRYVLETMNTWYSEGLLPENYVTMDSAAGEALTLEDNFAAVSIGALMAFYEDPASLHKFTAIAPLSAGGEYEPVMPAQMDNVVYTSALSHTCSDIDVALRFLDYWYYSMEGVMYRSDGPVEGSEDCLGMISGEYWNLENNEPESFKDVDNGMHILDYICGKAWLSTAGFGNVMFHEDEGIFTWRQLYAQANGLDVNMPVVYNTDTLDGFWRDAMQTTCLDYFSPRFPSLYFISEEETNYITDLKTVIEKYLASETAKFITGARPLDEFEDFQQEMKAIGMEDYVAFYTGLYARIKG